MCLVAQLENSFCGLKFFEANVFDINIGRKSLAHCNELGFKFKGIFNHSCFFYENLDRIIGVYDVKHSYTCELSRFL